MGEDVDKLLVEPINQASRPAILASLCLNVLKYGSQENFILQILLVTGAIFFMLSSFFVFFYCIYTTRRILRFCTAITFLLGLVCSITSSIMILITFF